jgi:K+-transporting ATPase ATPase C chain
MNMKNILFSSVKVLILMTVITGFIYPLFVTLAGQLLFNDKAEGSLIYSNGKVIGSALIGQQFNQDKYFHSRPSAIGYNPLPSGGSNYGPTSKVLLDSVNNRRKMFLLQNNNSALIPSEMLFASGSGVDPDISPEAAVMQIDRVIKARNFDAEMKNKLSALINSMIEKRQFGFLGEEKINVLRLNIELDKIK